MSAARKRRCARRVVGALVGSAVLLVGCGVTSEDRPVRIDRKEVPFGLLKDTPPTTNPDAPTSSTGSASVRHGTAT